MKITTLLTILTAILFLFACKKEKECPAFNESDLNQIAYNEYDTLKFVNQQNEEYNIYIQDFNLSGSFEQECVEIENVCPCINYVEVMAINSNSSSSYTFLKMEQSDASDMQYFKYKVIDYDFELDFINEVKYVDDFPYMEFKDTISINNTLYNDVVIYSNLDNDASNVLKVFLNKADGVLKIHQKDNVIWDREN